MQKGVSIWIDPSGAQTGGRVIKRELKEIGDAAINAQKMTDQLTRAQEQMAKSAQGSALAIGQQQDALRAKFNPTFAVIQRFKQTQDEIRQAHRLGAISVNEMSAALSRERQAALSAVAAIKGHSAAFTANTAAIMANNAATRAASMQRANLLFQLNDVGVSLASGMNPLMVLIQQGSQISQIYGSSEGGIGRAFKETAAMATALVARIWPLAAALGAVYGAYKLVSSFSAAARNDVSALTRSMAEQAMSATSLKGAITDFASIRDNLVNASGISGALGSVISLQGSYNAAIGESAAIQTRASSSIVSDLRREYEAKRLLLEIESKLQDAKIATQRADLEAKRAQLREQIGDQVFTRGDLEAQGFSDPRLGRFTRLPDSVTGIEKINSVIANSPIALEVAKMSAELALSENQAKKLKETLSQTFAGAVAQQGVSKLDSLISQMGASLTTTAQAAQTSFGSMTTAVQTAGNGVINVTQTLAMAQTQQLTALQQSSSQLRTMERELTDVSAALKAAANLPPVEIFGDRVDAKVGAQAIAEASTNIEKLFAAMKNGGATAQTVHEAIEMIRQSLKAMGGDAAFVDRLVDAMVAGQMEALRLAGAIQQASRSAGGAFYSDGTPVPAAAIAPAYRTRSYLVDQSDIDTMYQTLGYQISGTRAAGGPVSAGGTYLVGEQGPELLNMSGAGQVTNANSTASILSGGRDTLSLMEDHLYSAVQELRIHSNYFETFESEFTEMIGCLNALKSAGGSSSYSGASSYSSGSSRGSYGGSSSSGGQSHLDPYSPYYFNAARNFAGRGGGRYDPVADAMLNGNINALRGVSGGATQGISNMLSESGMPSLLDRLKKQYGFATGGQIMPGEDQRVEFFKKNTERVIVVDDSKVSDSRGSSGAAKGQTTVHAPISVTFQGDASDPRSRQAVVDDIRRTVLQVMQNR